ncbi:hypothetical protein DFH06DRAFT_1331684 [Mycena polygramma]|nr:hypothetical protein DFH06DRAFT_1331684 [Mycena polygramma]
MPTVLEIFSTPRNITWDTNFPEPELSNALRTIKQKLYGDRDLTKDRLQPDVLFDNVGLVRNILYHFRVPDDQVDERMAAMGMLPYWHAMLANFRPPRLFIPPRELGDTSPFVWE